MIRCITWPARMARAFTLIELLIVVAIIAILAAIAVPNFLEAQTRAKVSRVRADMQALATGVETYAIDYGKYMPAWEFPAYPSDPYTRSMPFHLWVPSLMTTPVAYLSSLPNDPFNPIDFYDTPAHRPLHKRIAYWNMQYMVKSVPEGSVLTMYRKMRETGGDYIFYSFGPDRLQFNNLGGVPITSQGVYRDYDATNGTVSAGNVFRTQKNGERFGTDPYFY